MLVKCIDSYIKNLKPSYNVDMKKEIYNSDYTLAWLLHYFERGNKPIPKDVMWCGWHNDHGGLTGLCSSMYFD